MQRPKNKDVGWKDVMNSKPEGSFLFPQHIVVEELLEQIDDTWETLWEGAPRKPSTSSSGNSSTDATQNGSGEAPKRSWFNRAIGRMKRSKNPQEELASRMFSIDRLNSLIPRFPSWVVLNEEEKTQKNKQTSQRGD